MPPKPKPRALKLLEGRGNGRDSSGRVIHPSPGYARVPPEPPDILSGVALDEWHRVLPELQRLQLTKALDRAALTAYCLAVARLHEAQRILSAEGLLHEGSQGRSRHPALIIAENASKEIRAWANEFGFTPSAENRMTVATPDENTDDNPFA
jgi:P27 family predicted phage terminase small subunit